MKLFISADLEGVTGITHWDEAKLESPFSKYFCEQMTKEVKAASEAALETGAEDILIKDAHSTARNIDPSKLPEKARILRGWTRDPYMMMSGLDNTFNGVLFIGYHSAAGTNGNPLSHTMNGNNDYVLINGQYASEFLMNAYTAAMFKVPVLFVSGDKLLCEQARGLNPNIGTVAVSEGLGNASISMHPDVAARAIKNKVHEVMKDDFSKYLIKLPDEFKVEIRFKEHYLAYRGSFYPGAEQIGTNTLMYEAADYMEVLRFFMFVL